MHNSSLPGGHVGLVNDLGRHFPRTRQPVVGQSLEIELAADLRVRTTSVRNIIRIEWHHMCEEFRASRGV